MSDLGGGDLIADYDFELPDDLIALRPAEPRSDARLLVVNGRTGTLEDRRVGDLPDLLCANDILVVNTTRVIPAALTGVRLARDPGGADVSLVINLNRRLGANRWSVFLRPGKRVREGDSIVIGDRLAARAIAASGGGEFELEFDVSGAELETAIDELGSMPLPPYILSRRVADEQDKTDYQTSYAESGESVAAPTAGLHLSPELLEQIARIGVGRADVRLDVNAGTFRPVLVDRLNDHQMHAERAVVTADVAGKINAARGRGGRCIAVGTTSMRTLESAATDRGVEAFDDDTSIFIRPGHHFSACDGLLTNFHLPRSTLFVLVSAFMGRDLMRRAYQHAVDQRYRFFSYGDACLLLPNG